MAIRCVSRFRSSLGQFEVGDVIDHAGLELALLNSSRESFEFIEEEGRKLAKPEPAVGVEHPAVPLVSKPARGFRRKG